MATKYGPVIALNARRERGLVVETENFACGHFVVDAIAKVAALTAAEENKSPITYCFEGQPIVDRYCQRYIKHKTLDVIAAGGSFLCHYDTNELNSIPEFDPVVELMNSCCLSILSYAFIADRQTIIAAWGHGEYGQLEYTTTIAVADLLEETEGE